MQSMQEERVNNEECGLVRECFSVGVKFEMALTVALSAGVRRWSQVRGE